MTAINIGLHLHSQVIDIRIPRNITIARLREVIISGLETQGIFLSPEIRFRVLNKALHLEDEVFVRDYPLADGDQIGVEFISNTTRGI